MINLNTGIVNTGIINWSLATLYVLFGFVVGRFAGKFFGKIVRRLELSYITEKIGIPYKPEFLAEKGISSLIYIITIGFALHEIGMPPIVKYILLVLLIVLAAILVALSVKEFIPNLIIGFYLRAVKHLKPGDKIKSAGLKVTVSRIGLLETKVITPDKNIIFFPNSYFAKRIKLKLKR